MNPPRRANAPQPTAHPTTQRLRRRQLLQGSGSAALAAALGAGLPALGWAQASAPGGPGTAPASKGPTPLPLALFLRSAELASVQLAPDGRSLLALRLIERRNNLIVIDLESRSVRTLTRFQHADVVQPMWLNAERILFRITARQDDLGDRRRGLYAVNKDGSALQEPDGDMARTFLVARGSLAAQGQCIVGESTGRGRHVSLARLDTFTGKLSRMSLGAPGDVQSWALDAQDRPRAAITRAEGQYTLWIKPKPEGEWQSLRRWKEMEPEVALEAIDADGMLYVVATPEGANEAVLMGIELAQAAWNPQPLVAAKGFDILPGGVRLDAERRLRSVEFETTRPQVVHADAALDTLQTALAKQFPDRTLRLQPSDDGATVLVSVSGDVDPGQFFLYTRNDQRLSPIGKARPWLDPARLAPTRFFRYTARDGLSIPAMLTLPPGAKPGEKHPLLVLHYGGPHVRAIAWRFDPTVQFLASRGYAVFMPAPRISTGWGRQHFEAGFRQWGLGMQDDVTDGVLQLVNDGIADRDRLALVGASYGGYLTMMGLVKNPELWRCGVNWIGVTDPEHMYFGWTDFAQGDADKYSLPVLLGHPERDREQFARTSPLKRVAEIQAPVLMAYGGLDRRVPLANGTRMHNALQAAGKQVDYIVYPEEGHGWASPATNLDFWTRVERFLALHMAPRPAQG